MRNRARRADAGKRRTEILLLLSYCTTAMSFNPGNFGFGFLRINTLSYARNAGAICNRIRRANTMRNRARRIKNFPARRPHFAARFGEDKICPFARAQCQIRNIKKFAPAKFAASQGSPLRKTFSPARKHLITPARRSVRNLRTAAKIHIPHNMPEAGAQCQKIHAQNERTFSPKTLRAIGEPPNAPNALKSRITPHSAPARAHAQVRSSGQPPAL